MIRAFSLFFLCITFLDTNGQDTIRRNDGTYVTGKIYDINTKSVWLIEPSYLHKKVLHKEIASLSFSRPGCSFDKLGRLHIERTDTCALPSNEIYQNTSLWFARTFPDVEMLRVDEQEAGIISGRINGSWEYTVTVQFKEQKYRILVDNLRIRFREYRSMGAYDEVVVRDLDEYMKEDYYTETGTVEQSGKSMELSIKAINGFLDELESALQKPTTSGDW